jgi:hypothetical protein
MVYGQMLQTTIGDVFCKTVSGEKIRARYHGNYVHLWGDYVHNVTSYIESSAPYGLIEEGDNYVAFLPKNEACLDDIIGATTWPDFLPIAEGAMRNVDRFIDTAPRTNNSQNHFTYGVESALWNFDAHSRLFDFDPPRLLAADGSPITFSSEGNNDHQQRTAYRCLTAEGLVLNLLVTSLLRLRQNKSVYNTAPPRAARYLSEACLEQLSTENRTTIDELLAQETPPETFTKHPLTLYRKELANGEF